MILIIQPVCVCVHNHMYYVNDYMCINASVFFLSDHSYFIGMRRMGPS